jgi:hypothetical protein
MKRLLTLCLLLCGLMLPHEASAQIEYLRPTADATTTLTPGCAGTNVAESSMSAVYTGKTGIGPTGSSFQMSETTFGKFKADIFSSWASTSKTYSGLSVYVSASYGGLGYGGVMYSINGGSSWALLSNLTSSQATYSCWFTPAQKVPLLPCTTSGRRAL